MGLRIALIAMLGSACGGTTAPPQEAEPEPTTGREPTPVSTAISSTEEVVGNVVAQRLAGPFESACAAIRADGNSVDCALLGDLATAEPTGPFRAVRFAEIVFEEGMPDSSCQLLVQTEAGWFHLDLDLLCGNSGSVRTEVTGSFAFHAIGPEGLPRLLVSIEEAYSHSMDGIAERSKVALCGTNDEHAVSCTYWWVAERTEPVGEGFYTEDDEVPEWVDWRAELRYEPTDIVVIGEHEPPEHDAHPLPGIGRYRVSF